MVRTSAPSALVCATSAKTGQRLQVVIPSRAHVTYVHIARLLLLPPIHQFFTFLDHLLFFQQLDRFGESLLCEPVCAVCMSLVEEDTHDVGWQNLWSRRLLTRTLSERFQLSEV